MNEREINVSFFRFEDLRIYAKAMDYIVWLYQQLPTNEIADTQKFMQKSFLRSAQDIALNTAEGSSRNRTQFLYYLKMAKSSVRECVVHTEIAFRSGVLTSAITPSVPSRIAIFAYTSSLTSNSFAFAETSQDDRFAHCFPAA